MTLAICVELLSGSFVATRYNDRDRVEWPPHPARLFSALVATWAEAEPDSAEGATERDALCWLEDQPAPEILASPAAAAGQRTVVPVFVPVNDVFTVSPPDTSKLEAAVAAANGTGDGPGASKHVAKLTNKLLTDTAKAISPPKKFAKDAVASAAGTVLAERRTKQPRTFPCATPAEPAVVYVWSDSALPEALRPALECLLARLVRLGHSSTLVSGRLLDPVGVERVRQRTTRFVPDPDRGGTVLRWVSRGQVERLEQAFERHRETEPRVLPATFVRYREGEQARASETPCTVFESDFVVFARAGGPRLPITSVVGIARQFRRALMAAADEPISELLSGHKPDGDASEQPHAAIVPLPVVGSEHSDGAILGVAVILPRTCAESDRRAVFRAIGRLESRAQQRQPGDAPFITLLLGRAGTLELERIEWGEHRRATLKPGWWARSSRVWATATPIALDKNPGDLHDRDPQRRKSAFDTAEQIVRTAVDRIFTSNATGVEPAELLEVNVVRSCLVPGSAKPRAYPRFPVEQARPQRVLAHARLVFDRPVRGPILLGAGRYQGLGLCLPLDRAE